MGKSISTVNEYRDNFDIKKQAEEQLIEKYFDDIDVNLRTVGMVGFTSEQIGNISEDTFNTMSILYQEMFPTRAQIPESIYSHASIFQISDIFSTPSVCNFIIVLDEQAIIDNALSDIENYDKASGIYKFFIDKDTTIYVEDIPYTLDYDIEIDLVVKKTNGMEDKYVFTAHYLKEYTNSISDINNTYVKLIRSGYGYLAMEVRCHQVIRDVREESINSSNLINYPVIVLDFDGKIAGFDVLYKSPTTDVTSPWTQLDKNVIFSQPLTTPFCYYRLIDTDKLEITFNSKDNYWSPEFNSDLQIILYITDGGDSGTTFDVYTGTNIEIVPTTEKYDYSNTYLTAAKPVSSSKGGQDKLNLDALQDLTVEGYRTANALTTENDLNIFLSNYKYRYGNADIRFFKRRDDIYERVYSAFMIMKDNKDKIYYTNTLKLQINVSDFTNVEGDIWVLEPGYLFTANDKSGYASLYRNPDLYDMYYDMYQQAIANDEIPYLENDSGYSDIPAYLDRPASFAEFKRRNNLEDKVYVFDIEKSIAKTLDSPITSDFLLINPFLLKFKKDPNLVTAYLTCLSNQSILDFYAQNDGASSESNATDSGSFVQFIANSINMVRKFEVAKRYIITMDVSPNIATSTDYPILQGIYEDEEELIGYVVGDKYNLGNNDLRVFLEVMAKDGTSICLTEMYPVSYIFDSNTITFQAELYTNDHITSDNRLKISSETLYRDFYTGVYYKEDESDTTSYILYDTSGDISDSGGEIFDVVRNLYEAGDTYYNKTSCAYYTKDASNYVLHNKTGEEVMMYVDTNTDYKYRQSLDNPNVYYAFDIDDNPVYINDDSHTIVTTDINDITMNMIGNGHGYATPQIDTEKVVDLFIEYGELEPCWFKRYQTVINLTDRDDILIPMEDAILRVRTVYKRIYDSVLGGMRVVTSDEANTSLINYQDSFIAPLSYKKGDVNYGYIWTNEYRTYYQPVTFIKALDSIRMYLSFLDYTSSAPSYDEDGYYLGENYVHDIMDVEIYSIPFVRWDIINDKESLDYFISSFYSQYLFLEETINTRLRNQTNIDIKFYRTYGCSNNYIIGEEEDELDVLNLKIEFDVWFVQGCDTVETIPEVKEFIKTQIEQIDSTGFNNLYISNLMRKIETEFDYVDHIRFVRINNYDSSLQAVKGKVTTFDELDVEERRWYVPEMLLVDLDDIIINEYTSHN